MEHVMMIITDSWVHFQVWIKKNLPKVFCVCMRLETKNESFKIEILSVELWQNEHHNRKGCLKCSQRGLKKMLTGSRVYHAIIWSPFPYVFVTREVKGRWPFGCHPSQFLSFSLENERKSKEKTLVLFKCVPHGLNGDFSFSNGAKWGEMILWPYFLLDPIINYIIYKSVGTECLHVRTENSCQNVMLYYITVVCTLEAFIHTAICILMFIKGQLFLSLSLHPKLCCDAGPLLLSFYFCLRPSAPLRSILIVSVPSGSKISFIAKIHLLLLCNMHFLEFAFIKQEKK